MKFFKFAFESVSSPYPPTYAAIIGKIPREHGLKDAITPPRKAMNRNIKENSPVCIFNDNSLINSSIFKFFRLNSNYFKKCPLP